MGASKLPSCQINSVSSDECVLERNMSNEKNPGCFGYIGDYTAQLYGDYNKPL